MTDTGDDASDERRLFGEKREETVALLASELGIVRVELAGDRVGGFGFAGRCHATSVTADGTFLVAADPETTSDGQVAGGRNPSESPASPSVPSPTGNDNVLLLSGTASRQ